MIYLLMLPGAFLAPIIHEWVKAMCSAKQGDPTPKAKGFLSGNPLKYFEPIGFFLMVMFGFGWGQPVPTSPLYYKDRRKGVLITYITPTLVNLLVGIAAAAVVRMSETLVVLPPGAGDTAMQIINGVLYNFARINIGLAFFNFIPVYPMDGARILQLFISPSATASMNRNEKMFQVLLLVLLFIGLPQQYIFTPLTEAVLRLVFVI